MKRTKAIIAAIMATMLSMSLFVGCGKGSATKDEGSTSSKEKGYKVFTAFNAVAGTEIGEDNRVKQAIAEKTGVLIQDQWLTGQTAEERVGVMIAGGEYPDFINGGDATQNLIDAGALIKIDEYLDDYPNLKNYLSEKDWDKVRAEDGHIYIIPQYGVIQGEETTTIHSGEAFWIQKAVLEWDGYPTITTLDEYFDLIQRYKEANPTIEGTPTIGFEILSDDWRYFCLENPPQFLAGYPNDGSAVVNPDTLEAKIYDTIPEAKEYYQKLNEMYNAGIVDSETFTASYDQYIAKLSTGAVLGMVDQYWQFMSAVDSLVQQGLDERTWVPLGLTIDPNVESQYRTKRELNVAGGIGVSVSCEDVEGALQFMNDLLDPELMTLRFWGEEGTDYEVDDNGLFYRTEEQRSNAKNTSWKNQNYCDYQYFPHFEGMLADGINTVSPGEQPGEFYDTLTEPDKEILDAYGFERFTDFLPEPKEELEPWFPIYSFTNLLSSDSAAGIAKQKMEDIKRQWLPKVIITGTDKFEDTWDDYENELNTKADVTAYEETVTAEVKRRVELFSDN